MRWGRGGGLLLDQFQALQVRNHVPYIPQNLFTPDAEGIGQLGCNLLHRVPAVEAMPDIRCGRVQMMDAAGARIEHDDFVIDGSAFEV
jgi:hypothetical protein